MIKVRVKLALEERIGEQATKVQHDLTVEAGSAYGQDPVIGTINAVTKQVTDTIKEARK